MRSKVPALPALLQVLVRGNTHRVGILHLRACCACLHYKKEAANTHTPIPAKGEMLPTSHDWSHCSRVKEIPGDLRYRKQTWVKNCKSEMVKL